jgi:hypothetical protein
MTEFEARVRRRGKSRYLPRLVAGVLLWKLSDAATPLSP